MKQCIHVFFLLMMALLASCNSHNQDRPKLPIDTIKLLDPQPQTGEPDDYGAMLSHCLMLGVSMDSVIVCFKGDRIVLTTNKLAAFLRDNSVGIREHKFYLLHYNNVPFKNITSIIDLVKAATINNYRVVNLSEDAKRHPLNTPRDE